MSMPGDDRKIIGKLIATSGRRSEITRLRIDVDGDQWGGLVLLAWNAVIQPGLFKLVMNDGTDATLFVESLVGEGNHGGGIASFRGCGPVPCWAGTKSISK